MGLGTRLFAHGAALFPTRGDERAREGQAGGHKPGVTAPLHHLGGVIVRTCVIQDFLAENYVGVGRRGGWRPLRLTEARQMSALWPGHARRSGRIFLLPDGPPWR